MTENLIAFLRARLNDRVRELDEDERVAGIIQDGGYLPPIWHAVVHPDGSADLYGEDRINYPPDAASEMDDEPFAHVKADRLQHAHIARWDPDRVLRLVAEGRGEVEAKRRILDLADPKVMKALGTQDPDFRDGYVTAHEDAIKALAMPYASHPDYREDWRP